MSKIDPKHRYLVRRNRDGRFVGSTDDLGAVIPSAHCLIDTIGEDGLGAGISAVLADAKAGRLNLRESAS